MTRRRLVVDRRGSVVRRAGVHARRAPASVLLGLALVAVVAGAGACGPDEPPVPEPGEDPIVEEVWLANYVDLVGDPEELDDVVEELGGELIGERETAGQGVLLAWFPSRSLDELEGYRSGLADRGIDVSRITRDEVEEVRDLLG